MDFVPYAGMRFLFNEDYVVNSVTYAVGNRTLFVRFEEKVIDDLI
ncbi:hypothetical protein JIR001_07360 [Polycladomyces abyssicola]|uniref:Uncharacterized protein n=1 Tax=Polycladomyces abyssicola TaxID=1125966 RepID=A0A8D5UDZ7_9BACL|nr:hypothetical protein JIR001_07360 [Polycladomyces abyssicola]